MPQAGGSTSGLGGYPAVSAAAPTSERDYRAENLAGIAKIMSTNPALGESMLNAYNKRTEHSESLIGGIWNAVTSPFRTGLELIMRPASAIAEPFRNEETGDEDNPLMDVWQGLTGQEHTTWRENLESYGSENKWLNGILGFAGDVFLDPMTYVGAGGMGMPREMVAQGAKDLGTYGALSLVRNAVKKDGGLYFQGKLLTDETLVKTIDSLGREAAIKGGVSDEFVNAISGLAAGNADRTLLRSVDDVAQLEAKWVGLRVADAIVQRKSARSLPSLIKSEVTGKIWRRDEMLKIFEDTARMSPKQLSELGTAVFKEGGVNPSMMGRVAAASLGGVRMKFGLPFGQSLADMFDKPWLGYRWTSGDLPLMSRWKLTDNTTLSFTKMGDFFRGVSGINRLDTAIQKSFIDGTHIWKPDDMERLLRDGFGAFEKKAIESGRGAEFQHLFGNKMVSSFFNASERMGGLTAHFTPMAQEWRRAGYIGMKAGHELQNAKIQKKLFRAYASQHEHLWSKARLQLEKDAASGLVNKEDIFAKSIKYLEGTSDDISDLPAYVQDPIKQMRDLFPRVISRAKRTHGVDIGDINEVYARTRADKLLSIANKKIAANQKAIEKLNSALKVEEETMVAELGARAAKGLKSPKVSAFEEKIAELENIVTKTTEEAKDISTQIAHMDEYENTIKYLRGPRAVEKINPKFYFHRRLTPEARQGLVGSIQAKYQHWGKAKKITAQMERVLAHKSFAEAEQWLRRRYPAALEGVKKVWEDDPFSVYAAYIEDMSEAVFKAEIGSGVQHIMGHVGAIDNGLAVRLTAHVPADMYPRNVRAGVFKTSGGHMAKYKNLHEMIDDVHVAIGAKTRPTSNIEGAAAWAGREPWREARAVEKTEYLHINDIDEFKDYDFTALKNDVSGKYNRKTIDELKTSILEDGYKEPIILSYNPETRQLLLDEGNHRLQAAKELLAEGHKEAAYIPTTVLRGGDMTVTADGLPVKLLDEAHAAGTVIPGEGGYIPGNLKPSELFAVESGKLGKVPTLTDDEAAKATILMHELNRAKTQAKGMVAEPEVAFKKLDLAADRSMWGKVDVPGFEDFGFHPFIAAEINKTYGGMKQLPFPWAQHRWRKWVMGPWKKAATIYFPGFHARNFMGAWFNNDIGGVGIHHYGQMHRIGDVLRNGKDSKWAEEIWKTEVRIDGQVIKNMKYKDIAAVMHATNVVGGNNLAIADLRSFLSSGGVRSGVRSSHPITRRLGVTGKFETEAWGKVTSAEAVMRGLEEAGIRTTMTTENFFRGAAFLKGLEDGAGDTAAARAFTMMRHGDYDELTDLENSIRDLIPFYKWLRTNIPFQVKQLIENPGKQLTTMKLANNLVSEEDRKKLPSWMQESLQIPMPKNIAKFLGSKDGGGLLSVQLPLHDLYMGSNEFASSFLPVARQLVLENMLFKKNLFTGAPLEGTQMTEMAGWMHTIGLAQGLRMLGIGKEGENGKVYISDRWQNVANVFPIYARSRAFLSEDPDRTSLRWAGFLSAVAGVRPEKYDDGTLNDGEREWFYNVLDPQLTQLRELGYKLPSVDELGAALAELKTE